MTSILDHTDIAWRPTDQLVAAGLEFEFHPRNDQDSRFVKVILQELWDRYPGLELLTYELEATFPLVPRMYLTFHLLQTEGFLGDRS